MIRRRCPILVAEQAEQRAAEIRKLADQVGDPPARRRITGHPGRERREQIDTVCIRQLEIEQDELGLFRRDRFERGVRRILEDGIESGRFASGNPKLLAFALFGAVNWIPRWFNPEGPASSQQIADLFADFFIRGLKA